MFGPDRVAPDVAEGLLPCLVVATVGTTSQEPSTRWPGSATSPDRWGLGSTWMQRGPGSAPVCPEHRDLLDGLARGLKLLLQPPQVAPYQL
ncbi:MAG: hypothetical protein CM1200mP26_04720 [Acidimicrobiales bacterium]|nr:MAG: hypothetical protein CM1200mP26_04720 [Acidimicrobiales bacterium]